MSEKAPQQSSVTNVSPISSTAPGNRIQDVEEGATLARGEKVKHVYAKSATHVIYRVEGDDSIVYTYTNPTALSRESIRRFERLMAKGKAKLKGIRDDQLNGLAVSALRTIFQEQSIELHEAVIRSLEEYVTNLQEVEAILARDKDFVVWIDHSGFPQYRYKSDAPEILRSVSEFTRINALAKVLLPPSLQRSFSRRLGAALAGVLPLIPGKNIDAHFAPLEEYIQRYISDTLRIRFLTATSSAAIFLVSCSYILYQMASLPNFLHVALIVIAGGYFGTFISVFERSKTLSVGDNESTKLIIFQGTLRVFLGGIFGLIAYAAASSGMAFTLFKDTTSGLLLLGVAAGFSERLIPDLIHGFSPKGQGKPPDSDMGSG
ncbi:MAG: hypothetical protein Q8S20_11555 [Sulfuritalea sp.]|nr:hypothetical protein [Sulfuritalea sp.]